MAMRMQVVLKSTQGYNSEATLLEVRTVEEGLRQVTPILERMPEKVGDNSQMDWDSLSITFERNV